MSTHKYVTQHSNVQQVINTGLFLRQPFVIWGSPGIGKTQCLDETVSKMYEINEHGEKEYYKLRPVLAGSMEPTDIGGIPFHHELGYADYVVPFWAWAVSDHPSVYKHRPDLAGPTCLFFDDITTADEQTQSTFHKFIHEGLIGEFKVRKNVLIVAAGNRSDDKSAAREMIKSLANRFIHYTAEASATLFCEWGIKNNIHQNVIAFLRSHGDLIDQFDPTNSDNAYATPRSWHALSTQLHILDAEGLRSFGVKDSRHDDSDPGNITYQIARGTVGDSVALQFNAFISATSDMVSVDDIIKDPKGCALPDENRPEQCWATVSGIEHRLLEDYTVWKAAGIYALRLQPEFGMLLASKFVEVVTQKLPTNERLEACGGSIFTDIAKKWGQFFAS